MGILTLGSRGPWRASASTLQALQEPESTGRLYLPLVRKSAPSVPRINVPYFTTTVPYSEMAIFWFGQVNSSSNYADVRLGYTGQSLTVRVNVFDRWLWYDTTPDTLTAWDAVTLLVDVSGQNGSLLSRNAYRFEAQLSNTEDRSQYQQAYRSNGTSWEILAQSFATVPGWRGSNLNNNTGDDRGWAMKFEIPFASLGLSTPSNGQVWNLGLILHDRDSSGGPSLSNQVWPNGMNSQSPATWGQLRFGTPTYTPPSATIGQTVVIRQGLNGATVPDAAVGGTVGNLCPGSATVIWEQWANYNFGNGENLNIQNQSDIADWPCFSKYYIAFPLTSLPAGKVILSAKLTLYQTGNAGASGQAKPSYIQVSSVKSDWNEATITWNNAPLAWENVAASWVDPIVGCGSTLPWPCVARSWDVTRAVAEAYASGQPLNLALYSADSDYHSGKYFTTSETGDWNAIGRPTLQILWGTP